MVKKEKAFAQVSAHFIGTVGSALQKRDPRKS